MFLVATLYHGRASNPVRVRNLSASGALVEGASLPPVGTGIILRRGALEPPGSMIWSEGKRAGLAFDVQLDVAAWLPAKEAKGQTQVDQFAFAFKHAAAAAPSEAAAQAKVLSAGAALAELSTLRIQIREIGVRLALDGALPAHHSDVRLLDATERRLGQIVTTLRGALPY